MSEIIFVFVLYLTTGRIWTFHLQILIHNLVCTQIQVPMVGYKKLQPLQVTDILRSEILQNVKFSIFRSFCYTFRRLKFEKPENYSATYCYVGPNCGLTPMDEQTF